MISSHFHLFLISCVKQHQVLKPKKEKRLKQFLCCKSFLHFYETVYWNWTLMVSAYPVSRNHLGRHASREHFPQLIHISKGVHSF